MVWGYYELDSIVEACEEYILALEIMEEHFDEKELVGEKSAVYGIDIYTFDIETSGCIAVFIC